jgi:Amt family ammonium transporter
MDSQTIEALVREGGDLHAAATLLVALVAGFVALLAQTGFGLLATGMVRAKNAAHTMAMSFVVFAAGILGYWAIGFALQSSGSGHLSSTFGGFRGFFLNASVAHGIAPLFMVGAVAGTVAATIPIGAVAERSKLSALVLFALATTAFIYPVFAHWVWGGGWLSSLGKNFGLGHGVVDCAGSGVVHMTGGLLALIAAKMVGPRLGKYSLRGDVRPIPAHNMPLVVLGTLVLASAWFALAVSASSLIGGVDVGTMAVNALLASAAGGMAAFLHTRLRFGKPDLSLMCNGLLAGLVAISASGALVGSGSAVLIGLVASVLAIEGALIIERKLKIDDPVGAFAVHGLGGAWGLLSVGIFANGVSGNGLHGVAGPVRGIFAGSAGQLGASLVGIVANVVWVVPLALVALAVVGRIVGNRPTADDEIAGLDVPELGMTGYVTEAVHASSTRSSDLGQGGRPARVA